MRSRYLILPFSLLLTCCDRRQSSIPDTPTLKLQLTALLFTSVSCTSLCLCPSFVRTDSPSSRLPLALKRTRSDQSIARTRVLSRKSLPSTLRTQQVALLPLHQSQIRTLRGTVELRSKAPSRLSLILAPSATTFSTNSKLVVRLVGNSSSINVSSSSISRSLTISRS